MGLWSGWLGCYFHWVSILRLWLSGWQSKWLLAQLGIDSSYLLWAFDICVFRFKIVVSMIGKPAIVTLPVYYGACGSCGAMIRKLWFWRFDSFDAGYCLLWSSVRRSQMWWYPAPLYGLWSSLDNSHLGLLSRGIFGLG